MTLIMDVHVQVSRNRLFRTSAVFNCSLPTNGETPTRDKSMQCPAENNMPQGNSYVDVQ